MANKQALRDLQSRLAERLSAVKTEPAVRSWLAVECGARGFLFPLGEAGEIFPFVPLLHVPYSRHWFLGVANLRGHLHGVVDLAGFLGAKAMDDVPGNASAKAMEKSPDAGREHARLVGFNQALELNCALLVDRLSGLRGERELSLIAEPDAAAATRPAFVGARYRDAAGRVWQELRLAELAGDAMFLRIVAGPAD